MFLFYATRDGQSSRIAARLAGRLAERGITATPINVGGASLTPADITRGALAVAVFSVRYGRHLREASRFLALYRSCQTPPPLVLVSVNLTARKSGKDTAEGNTYLRKLIARNRLTPVLATAFAGRLDYPRYRWLDRQIIRFIMLLTGGPTDPSVTVEYTSWDAVDAFAERIGELYWKAKERVA